MFAILFFDLETMMRILEHIQFVVMISKFLIKRLTNPSIPIR
jgi:hypothetical protein